MELGLESTEPISFLWRSGLGASHVISREPFPNCGGGAAMPVPCPVPLQSPWSPVGYRVVEVLDEKIPAVPVFGAGSAGSAGRAATPSSPVGYRVLELADEKLKVLPRFRRRASRSPERSPQRPSRAGLLPGLGGSIIVAVVLRPGVVLALVASRTSRTAPAQNALRQVAIADMPQRPVLEVNIPDAAVGAAGRDVADANAAAEAN